MSNAPRIVVGVDDSPAAHVAATWATQEARLCNASLVFAYAEDASIYLPLADLGLGPASPSDPSLLGAAPGAPAWLVDLSQDASRQLPTPVSVAVGAGSPARHVIEQSAAADLVVVGTRGRGGLRSAVLGSTSQQLTHHAPCPVVVVPDSDPNPQNAPVVVGVDGSPESLAALTLAGHEASLRQAPLHLVHSWSPSLVSTLPPDPTGLARVSEDQSAEGARTLRQARERVTSEYPLLVVTEHLDSGSAAAALLTAAASASMVVVGSRGRGGFSGLLLGSVSSAVLHDARVPVMVVRA
jgi:nucleotide-binding universal stress UspA family protein